jgi:hypothetical protein
VSGEFNWNVNSKKWYISITFLAHITVPLHSCFAKFTTAVILTAHKTPTDVSGLSMQIFHILYGLKTVFTEQSYIKYSLNVHSSTKLLKDFNKT